MSRIALLIGADEKGKPALTLPEARRRTMRHVGLWDLPTASPVHAAPTNIINLNLRPIESARHALRRAEEAGTTHLVLFGARVREAFELALLVRLQPDMPRTVNGITIVAAKVRSVPSGTRCRGVRRDQPLCFAYLLEESLPLAA